jgi:hypothetical protein
MRKGALLVAFGCLLAIALGTAACTSSSSLQVHAARPPSSTVIEATGITTTTSADTTSTTSSPGAVLTISPPDLRVGQPVTLEGNDCSPPDRAEVGAIGSPNAYDLGTFVPQSAIKTASDGRWTATVRVDDGTQLGPISIGASCQSTNGSTVVLYPTVSVYVTTDRELILRPGTTISPGQVLSIRPIGNCPVGSGFSIALSPPFDLQYESWVTTNEPTNSRTGSWTARLRVPKGLHSGSYSLRTLCLESRATTAIYPSVTITLR